MFIYIYILIANKLYVNNYKHINIVSNLLVLLTNSITHRNNKNSY